MAEADVLQQMLEDTPPVVAHDDDALAMTAPTAAAPAAPMASVAEAPTAEMPADAKKETPSASTPADAMPTSTTTPSGRGRRRAHGTGRKQSLSLRQPVTFAQKLEIINFYETQQRDINATIARFYSELSAEHQASRKRQIYRWVKERSTIEQMCFKKSTANQTRRRDKGTATTLSQAAEQELLQWITSLKDQEPTGRSTLSTQVFRAKAMEIAAKYDVPKGSFQATWTWQQGFLKRHQLSSL